MLQNTKIYENFPVKNTTEQLILFRADFHANHSAYPDLEREQKITAIYGKKCYELYGKYSQLPYLVKMCLVLSEWNSTTCKPIWKVQATKHKRLLFRLVPLERGIKGIEFGLFATPNASDSVGSTGGGQGRSLRTDVKLYP